MEYQYIRLGTSWYNESINRQKHDDVKAFSITCEENPPLTDVFPQKDMQIWVLMFSFIVASISCWTNSWVADNLSHSDWYSQHQPGILDLTVGGLILCQVQRANLNNLGHVNVNEWFEINTRIFVFLRTIMDFNLEYWFVLAWNAEPWGSYMLIVTSKDNNRLRCPSH